MIDEPGGGTRPELPVVLGGRAASSAPARHVPLRTILGASSRGTTARRLSLGWWGSVAWTVAVLACATSAFAIRDTMFPQLGRTQPPSAWEAPTRPPASIPYSEREGIVPTGTTIAPPATAATDGTPLLGGPVTASTVGTGAAEDDDGVSSAVPTGSNTRTSVAGPALAPAVTAHTAPTVSSDVNAPTTTDNVTSTTDAAPDDGGGNQRGRSPGGSTGDTLP